MKRFGPAKIRSAGSGLKLILPHRKQPSIHEANHHVKPEAKAPTETDVEFLKSDVFSHQITPIGSMGLVYLVDLYGKCR